jgi:hypothetical protein
MPEILLSVLIPTVPWRDTKLHDLLRRLDPQVARDDVELLVLRDNRSMTIGEKRNKLRAIARGQYLAFVDDDDMVADDYVATILTQVSAGPDVINFFVNVEGHGPPKVCRYGLSLQHENLETEYHRKPNHLMVWKRELATSVAFVDTSFGEDTIWAEEMGKRARTEKTIKRVLYTYQFDPKDNSGIVR